MKLSSMDLKFFCASVITMEHLESPVTIQLFDIGANFVFGMQAEQSPEGLFLFSDEKYSRAVATPGPYTVRFTAPGKPSFERDSPPKAAQQTA